jgi:hypothetical protein
MKNAYIYVLTVITVLITGCDIKSPVDGIDIILNQKDIATTVAVSFTDASTGQQIGSLSDKEIKIEFAGRDKDQLISLKELPLTETGTTNGIISFAIKNSRTPSAQNPVEFTLIASSPGYAPAGKNIIISKPGSNAISITMVNLSAPPDGSAGGNASVSASNGQVSSAVTITTGNESVTNAASTMSIPAGTGVKDETGNAVPGNLSASVLYFNNKNKESLASFPGGLIAKAVTSQGGSAKSGFFTTAGFAEFSLQNSSGQRVKTFSGKKAELSIDIPAGTINKNTGSPVKNGDVIPIWSFNESSAVWNYETDGTAAGPDANGNYKVSFESSHLSWWSLGWLGESVCSEGATINLNGNYASLTLEITDLNGNFIASQIVTSTENSVTILNAPAGIPVKITAYDNLRCSNNKAGETTAGDLCGSNITLDITAPGSGVNVTVEAFCPDRDPVLRVRPSIDIYVVNSCGERIAAGKMKDGFITLKSLVIGETYVFGVYYDDDEDPSTDNWHQSDPRLVDSDNYYFDYELDASVCDDL